MKLGGPLLQKVYDVVALVALLNVLVMGGLGVYAIGTGAINSDKARRVVEVLRGDDVQEEEMTPEVEEVKTTPEEGFDLKLSTDPELAREMLRREADRIKEELRQRLALNNSILLRVTTERDAFKRDRKTAEQKERVANESRTTRGFNKQVEIIEGLAPKIALQHILGMKSPDEAAKILLSLSARKARKVVESAKRGDQMKQMMTILQRVRDVAPQRSDDLLSG